MVHAEGFEPTTPGSEDRCSIQLSYACMNDERSEKMIDLRTQPRTTAAVAELRVLKVSKRQSSERTREF